MEAHKKTGGSAPHNLFGLLASILRSVLRSLLCGLLAGERSESK